MISDDDLKYVSEQVTYSIPIPFSNGYLTSFEIRELARELLERRKADRWIPVEEELPKDGIPVNIKWKYDDSDHIIYDVSEKLPSENSVSTRDGDFDKTVIEWRYIDPEAQP